VNNIPDLKETRIVNSALWAAVGDALGFITELADLQGVKRRAGETEIQTTLSWRRAIGGRFGALATLPAGAYSDDTQLRLATCRAIRSDGHFDVEAFAKIELPVWLSYGIGGGLSTKAAAGALRHQDVNWYSNFFKDRSASYIEAGGNGAAMRIQPHVWASKTADPAEYIPEVIRNAVCTHGHMRAIFGAVFHGFCLAETIRSGDIANPDVWQQGLKWASEIPRFIREDSELRAFWLPSWEVKSRTSIHDACESVRLECERDIVTLNQIDAESAGAFTLAYERLECFGASSRGSATKTTLIASWLAWSYRVQEPLKLLARVANTLNSDTDTIATMLGALTGAIANVAPTAVLMDQDYIACEARRLARISFGEKEVSFRYPDLLSWRAPQTQLDALGKTDGKLFVAGLGEAEIAGESYPARKADGTSWQWLRLHFGETILIRQRANLPVHKVLSPPQPKSALHHEKPRVKMLQQPALFDSPKPTPADHNKASERKPTIDELSGEAIRSGFDAEVIGKHLLSFSESPDGIEKAIAYSGIVVKARRARLMSSTAIQQNPTSKRGTEQN